MKSIVLSCGTNCQMNNVSVACRRLLDEGGKIQLGMTLVEMTVDIATIKNLKSIARERADFALTNAPHLRDSGSVKIAMGISGDNYHWEVVLLVVTDKGRTEITHSTTKNNSEEDCFILLQKIAF